ncbi:glycoside hydrolase family 3 C-terminal domain-containing protein [Winogradskya consettensis]|uniref:Glycosyl hydrolase n=1 Tax=Winogradskya consettensis TaxID=113560 RepID=A0A919SSJ0_9ACTN|nr:glycoside hydrolase family 3 C-terminal domain-containing protein [Actinoplanes consettensis]GIM77686.1 glycosyl hydrolase [Actinoplanes consettensis]
MKSSGSAGRGALVRSLSLPEKVALLTGASAFTLGSRESIGLGEVRVSDGPAGVRGATFSGGPTAVLLPNPTLLAAFWDEDAAAEAGRILAEEALARGVHVVLGPTVNLPRSPLGGRLFEAYSEDPLLTGKLAAAAVRAMQDLGVGAALKHLVANDSETARNTMSSELDEATLREVALLPFEIVVADADPWAIVAAYNRVNGTPATEHRELITGIVKGEWGYRGLVMSDWFAARSAGPAANAGLDLVMPGPRGPWGEALVGAVESGEVSEAVIDDHLGRLLLLAARVGALKDDTGADHLARADHLAGAPGSAARHTRSAVAPDSAARRAQLTRLAAQGMTVLVNENGTLPLDRARTVALIGRHAVETIGMGGGSAHVTPPYQVSVADGLRGALGDLVTVVDGVEVRSRPVPARGGFLTDGETGTSGVRVKLLSESGTELERRHAADATTTAGLDERYAEPVATVVLSAVITRSGTAELGVLGSGDWTVRIGDSESSFSLSTTGRNFGEELVVPPLSTGVHTVTAGTTFEASVRLGSGTDAFSAAGLFGLIGRPARRETVDVIDDAVRAAAGADVAVVVVGLTEEQETEGVDKSTLHLPGAQDALVEAVAGAARRTIVVVNAASPVIMPWRTRVDAVLWAGLPGQEAGHAIAAALLGNIEPAGRLVTTFPAEDGGSPAWSVTPVDGVLAYAEGRFAGYRGHDAGLAPAPAFWFGHGLGYTTWDYSDISYSSGSVAVTVTNTGPRAGREVVQIYFRPQDNAHPVRLMGWSAVSLPAGGSARVTVPTDPRMWRAWAGTWVPLGPGELIAARGLGDVRAALGRI